MEQRHKEKCKDKGNLKSETERGQKQYRDQLKKRPGIHLLTQSRRIDLGRISGAVWIDARNFHFFFTPVLEHKDLYYRYMIRSFSSELM